MKHILHQVCFKLTSKPAMTSRDPNDKNIKFNPERRGEMVLSSIISEHFITGEPVGSKAVAEKFSVSSATIRNVMSELEDLGLVEQPHTSAGRIPTDKGYRFYVDNLLGILQLSDKDLRLINAELGISESDIQNAPDRLMEKTSHLLSALSKNVGIVVSPSLAHDRLRHIEFVNLSDKRVLVILVSAPNIVHHKVIQLTETFPQEELNRTSRYLTAEFGGKSLAEIRTQILRLMHDEKAIFDKLLQTAVILCSQSIEDEKDKTGDVYVDGTSNILTQRDFGDFSRLRELLLTIEEKSRLVRILNECIAGDHSVSGNVQVIIGSENSESSLQNCTLITAPYRIGQSRATGALSVLGPTRMEYSRIISVVGYVAKMLEKLMEEKPLSK